MIRYRQKGYEMCVIYDFTDNDGYKYYYFVIYYNVVFTLTSID